MSDTITTLKTTAWQFSNSLDQSAFSSGRTWHINFTTSVGNYTALYEHWDSTESRGAIYYNDTLVYQGSAWLVAAQQSIVITGGDDVESASLIAWLTTNATQQDPQQALVYPDQLDADLRSVADSIRAKTGGQTALAFPEEFCSEIASITTGGMANPMENQGDIIVGGVSGTPTALSIGGQLAGNVLTINSSRTGLEWAPIPTPATGIYAGTLTLSGTWTTGSGYYSQDVTSQITHATAESIVQLTPTLDQLDTLRSAGVKTMQVVNNNGTITIIARGGRNTADIANVPYWCSIDTNDAVYEDLLAEQWGD